MPGLQVLPFANILGCVPVGYIYSIKLKVTNMSPLPEKLKISCNQPLDEPNQMKHSYMPVSLAPGMSKVVQLELHATAERTARYEVIILQENMERLAKELVFFIVDPAQYKSVSNTLSAANKRPYVDCVSIVGKITAKDESSLTNKSQTISTALIGDDEMEVNTLILSLSALNQEAFFGIIPGNQYHADCGERVLGPSDAAAAS